MTIKADQYRRFRRYHISFVSFVPCWTKAAKAQLEVVRPLHFWRRITVKDILLRELIRTYSTASYSWCMLQQLILDHFISFYFMMSWQDTQSLFSSFSLNRRVPQPAIAWCWHWTRPRSHRKHLRATSAGWYDSSSQQSAILTFRAHAGHIRLCKFLPTTSNT